jgi:hypothetical protein
MIDALINAWLRRPGLLKRLKITLALSDPKKGMRILEIGCGSGKYIVECAKKGANTWGIDIIVSRKNRGYVMRNCLLLLKYLLWHEESITVPSHYFCTHLNIPFVE